MTTHFSTVPTTAPTPYAITPIMGGLFELTWQGRPIDTFYSYVDAEDAISGHAALWEAEVAIVDDTPVVDWDEDDTGLSDQHGHDPDACIPLAPFHSYCEAAGHAFANFMDGVEARDCTCGAFHLFMERRGAAEFGAD